MLCQGGSCVKVLGAVFILFASGSVGFKIARLLKMKCVMLNQLLVLLGILRNEISFYGTQLSAAFKKMAAATNSPLKELFEQASEEMERQPWMTPSCAMEIAFENTPVDFLEDILVNLMKTLGKYDLDAQLMGIDLAEEETKKQLGLLEAERTVKSKTYRTLGLCAGTAAVIVLL